ncbi:MAG: HlyD family type I secretion periplasmic adaptor subunit [Cyanobacteria bacterium P01_A01_bin.37]
MTTTETQAAQSRQTRQQFVSPEDYLSYELGKAVRELPPLYTRLLAGVLSSVVVGAIVWAYASKIDEVAVAQGELIPAAQIRPVRALEGGVIGEIRVEEGDEVEQGDVLIVQDPALTQADVDRLSASAELIQQDITRLEAELNGGLASGTPLQDQLIAARLSEFTTRQQAADAEVARQAAALDESQARLTQLQASLPNVRALLENARDREENLRELVEGAVARFDYLEARDRLTEAEERLGSTEQQILVQQQAIRQAEQAYQVALQERDRLSSERESEILTQLNQRQEELTNLQGQLNQATIRADGQLITAPISGRVYNLQATLAEKTIEPGEELLSILPSDNQLLLEVRVLNRDIGFIREGMRAKVKIATFPFQEFGTIDGIVMQISPNAIVDEQLGPVFLTQIELNRSSMPLRGQEVALVPGMAATGEIVTRQKSVLTFMLEPVTRRFDEAFSVR